MDFVHLHVHTQFSFLTSTVKLAELSKRTKELGMSAVALTDHTNMFGAVRHYKACLGAGIRPILGCELSVARADGSANADHLVVLARNVDGYKNLVRLVSQGHLRPKLEGVPSLGLDDFAGRTAGLVALSGCLGGVVPQQIVEFGLDRGEPMLARLRDIFEPGRFFVELQDHGFPEQPVVNGALLEAARKLELPLVATNDV